MKMTGNMILITGGSMGIGLAFAKEFVKLGNQVIITGRNQDKLDAAAKEVEGLHTIRCDAGDAESVKQLAAEIERNFPEMNVLINNAGILEYRNLRHGADDLVELTQEVDINVSGPIRTVSVLIDRLKANSGTIINVSSGLAFVPLQAAPIYSATKAALHSYTLALRQQLTETSVEVIELMPPAIKTRLTDEMKNAKGFSRMSTEDLVKDTMSQLSKGKQEICPGQAKQLRTMSRVAPGFIQRQLEKGSEQFIPEGPM